MQPQKLNITCFIYLFIKCKFIYKIADLYKYFEENKIRNSSLSSKKTEQKQQCFLSNLLLNWLNDNKKTYKCIAKLVKLLNVIYWC